VSEYRVSVTERAARQLNTTADWVAERAPETAEKWFASFVDKVNSLSTHPHRCPLARESKRMPIELRQLLVGRKHQWRVLFTIQGHDVVVMAIRHSSQDDLTVEDLLPFV